MLSGIAEIHLELRHEGQYCWQAKGLRTTFSKVNSAECYLGMIDVCMWYCVPSISTLPAIRTNYTSFLYIRLDSSHVVYGVSFCFFVPPLRRNKDKYIRPRPLAPYMALRYAHDQQGRPGPTSGLIFKAARHTQESSFAIGISGLAIRSVTGT